MQVKNYYAMDEEELDKAIANIREWLWNFNGHEQYAKVSFALDVALNAKESYQARKADPWIQEVLDILC
jgi:hypothetical protein